MAKTRVLVEFGMGTSLRRADYTEAAARALRDALWRNSVNMAELFGFPKDAMIVEAEIGVQEPEQVDAEALKAVFPYGQPRITVVQGGLDIDKPSGAGRTVMANAAISVFFDMESTGEEPAQ
ncbi:Lin0512 family protein [Ruegeria sp. 2012CJ41-6]|uniref:Lin0512 family protein n=1 Tax=Ruegeria spongiae TaxID=2942209 RepID=A0ABT0Q1P7_9RHOB|nr:Lin0512 family protein [Ruegeria spongiae]MCL6283512.1 Lin0512 family protein [Ruegeria spongiae]